jgi:hypothetical protein
VTLLIHWRDLDPTERVARCRLLAMGARLLAGPKTDALCGALRRAEADIDALPACDIELHRLPTVPMRKLLCSFASTLR